MRVSTAFNKMVAIPGATVTAVRFTPGGVVVGIRLRRRRLVCPCGFSMAATYDRSIRRWRHLDLGACKLLLEAEIRRLWCSRCERVRTEAVPWAREGARFSRDLDDALAWCGQRMDKTAVSRLLRVSWSAVAGAIDLLPPEQTEILWPKTEADPAPAGALGDRARQRLGALPLLTLRRCISRRDRGHAAR